MAGLTFDTGALLALERRRQRMGVVFDAAREGNVIITLPAIVVAEWWRKRSDLCEEILESCDLEPLDQGLARLAGEATTLVRGSTINDAIVMASAARRGDIVYTSDFDDLERLRAVFPAVRVLRV